MQAQTNIYDVIIVGAGASGLVCALELARGGKKVLILEKEITCGRKILVSGNGECNFTNRLVAPSKYYGDQEFVKAALEQFSYQDALNYFKDLGLLYREENNRFFTYTSKASSVATCLTCALKEAGAEIILRTEVSKIIQDNKTKIFKVSSKQGQSYFAKNIVLACGSLAYPQVGGTKAGYILAQSFGHTIKPLSPALCSINLQEKTALTRIAGLKVQALASLKENGKLIAEEEGEVLFNAQGVSGNNIFSLSRNAKKGQILELNLFSNFTKQEFSDFIDTRAQKYSRRKLKDFFAGILADSIANLLIDFLGFKKNMQICDLNSQNFARIKEVLQAWPFRVEGLRPFEQACAAKGGVDTKEIQKGTFCSLKNPWVYIMGELLDIDGRCGGFNLHFAWTSAICVAKALLGKK